MMFRGRYGKKSETLKRFMTRKDPLCLLINFQARVIVVVWAVVVAVAVVVIFCRLNLIAVVDLLNQKGFWFVCVF
jgi:hypothetical protein